MAYACYVFSGSLFKGILLSGWSEFYFLPVLRFISDQNGSKAIPFGDAHIYIAYYSGVNLAGTRQCVYCTEQRQRTREYLSQNIPADKKVASVYHKVEPGPMPVQRKHSVRLKNGTYFLVNNNKKRKTHKIFVKSLPSLKYPSSTLALCWTYSYTE